MIRSINTISHKDFNAAENIHKIIDNDGIASRLLEETIKCFKDNPLYLTSLVFLKKRF